MMLVFVNSKYETRNPNPDPVQGISHEVYEIVKSYPSDGVVGVFFVPLFFFVFSLFSTRGMSFCSKVTFTPLIRL